MFRRTFMNIGAFAGLILTFGILGCENNPNQKIDETEQSIEGQPVSVKVAGGTHGKEGLSIVLKLSSGKYQLCSEGDRMADIGGFRNYRLQSLTDAAAIVQSEIDDDDSETVKIKGYYVGYNFRINTVYANGLSATIPLDHERSK